MYPAHIENGRVQTVEEHCKNVAEIAKEDASRIGIKNTVYLAGLLHDIGKSTNQFAAYVADDTKKGYERINHSSAGARYLSEHVHANSVVEKLTLELICYAVTSHHGVYDELSVLGDDELTNRIHPSYEIGYETAVVNSSWANADRFSDAVCEVQKVLQKIAKIKNTEQRYVQLGFLQRYICSCLKDGDWTDTAEFCRDEKQKKTDNKGILRDFLDKMEQQMDVYRSKRNNGSEKVRAINRARMEMSDICIQFVKNGDGIYRLSMPTGGGKTDASMRYALHLAKKTGKDRIFYIAPFISVLDQTSDHIRTLFGSEHVLTHHSGMFFRERPEEEKWREATETWSDPLILTTMVQFMNAMFSGRAKDIRRMHALADSVIIIDEVQSIPAEKLSLFCQAVNFLVLCCNSTVVLCTATQPAFEYLTHGICFDTTKSIDIIPDETCRKYAPVFHRTKIIDRTDQAMTISDLADFIMDVLDGSILVVLNTRRQVRNLYENLKQRTNIELIQLTTYMCPAHRSQKIRKIQKCLAEGSPVICISTSLIEAGVDLSFHTAVRDISGLDHAVQTAGRCNRNGEYNDICDVYLIKCEEDVEIRSGTSRSMEIGAMNDALMDAKNMKKDASDPEIVEDYFRRYYQDINRRSDDIIQIGDQKYTMIDILGRNISGHKYNMKYPYPLGQAYKTAGIYFRMIDEETVSVVVPYGDGKQLIEEFEEKSYPDYELLRKLQPYTVNLQENYHGLLQALLKRGIHEKHDVLICDAEYYDAEQGIKERE